MGPRRGTDGIKLSRCQQKIKRKFRANRQHHYGKQDTQLLGFKAHADACADLGADHGVNYVERDMREAVWEIVEKPRVFGVGGVDLVVNCTGGGTWGDSIRCLKAGGRLVTCGATAGFEEQIDVRYVWTFEHDRGSSRTAFTFYTK